MKSEYEIQLAESTIERDSGGRVIFHPLFGPYGHLSNFQTYGYLTFAGHDLDKSPLLDDVKVFYLEFFGEPVLGGGREAWADPLRATILQRLSSENQKWYLGVVPRLLDGNNPTDPVPFAEELERWQDFSKVESLESTIVRSEIEHGYRKGFLPRLFLEIPNHSLPSVVSHCWHEAISGYAIEGYNMMSGQMKLLREWDKKPRDDRLFREVVDSVFVAFYTFPAEHRHFAFVTNKLTLDDLKRLLDLQNLEKQAMEIGLNTGETLSKKV